MELDNEVSLPPFSKNSNSLNFSSGLVTNSIHLDLVPSLPTRGFQYGFPSNLSGLGYDHLQNSSRSTLCQPQKGFEFCSSSTFPQLESHQILENYSSSIFLDETDADYNFLYTDSSSLDQPQKCFEFGSSRTFPQLESHQILENYSFLDIDSSCLSSSSLPLGSDKGFTDKQKSKRKMRENRSDGIRIQDDDNHCEKGKRNVEESVGRRKWASNRKPKAGFGDCGSKFRGVCRNNTTGCFQAFLWDNTNPSVKGKTVYIGGFDGEEEAARAYDRAVLKNLLDSDPLNFPVSDYVKDLEKMQEMNRTEYLNSIRRTSKDFSKGISKFRGVSRTSNGQKWQARIGKGRGTKSIYVGIFNTEVEAARAYDKAVIKLKGSQQAITNFGLDEYDIKSIEQNEMIPVEGASKSLLNIPAKEILKRKTKDVKKPGALKLQEQSLVVPTNHNTPNIIPPPPQNPSYPQVILDLQGAEHGKIDAQKVPTLQEDQSLISDRNPDAQLEGTPREGSKSNLVGLSESDFEPTILPYTYQDFQSLPCQSPSSQNFPTFPDVFSTGASSRTGSISEAILGIDNLSDLLDPPTLEFVSELLGISSNSTSPNALGPVQFGALK